MIHYSAKTPKRHYGYSNSAVALEFDKGKLTQSDRKPKSERIRTADAYYDKKGVKRYKGNSNLRSTEFLECDKLQVWFPMVIENVDVASTLLW